MSAAACYLCLAPAAVAHRAAPLCEACNKALAVEHGLHLAAVPPEQWPAVTACVVDVPPDWIQRMVDGLAAELPARWRNTPSAWVCPSPPRSDVSRAGGPLSSDGPAVAPRQPLPDAATQAFPHP